MALWERQEKESATAYNAFWTYCSIPAGEKRSYVKVAKKLGKSDTLMRRWGKLWNWEQRALAYDNHLIEIEIETLKAERIAAAKRHVKIARSFQNKVIKRLSSLKPEDLGPKDLTSWVDVAVKIERQALGEPTELILQQLTGKDGGPVEIKRDVDLSGLTEEELIWLEKILVKIDGNPPASSLARHPGAAEQD